MSEGMFHAIRMKADPVNVLKKRKTSEKTAEIRAQEAKDRKKVKKGGIETYKTAEKFVKEHRILVKQRRQLQRDSSRSKNERKQSVPTEDGELLFVIRTGGRGTLLPKVKRILSKLRLTQINNGVFVKANTATVGMIKLVEPFVTFGQPSLKMVKDLVYKHGHANIAKKRVPLKDNSIVEKALGKHNIISMEDLVMELHQVGKHFNEATAFLYPFKLRGEKVKATPKNTPTRFVKKPASDRGEEIDAVIALML